MDLLCAQILYSQSQSEIIDSLLQDNKFRSELRPVFDELFSSSFGQSLRVHFGKVYIFLSMKDGSVDGMRALNACFFGNRPELIFIHQFSDRRSFSESAQRKIGVFSRYLLKAGLSHDDIGAEFDHSALQIRLLIRL